GQSARVVVGRQFFTHPAILLAGHVASGEMQKSCVIGRSHELENIYGGVRIRRQGVPQVGIEVGQARAINNEIKVLLQAACRLGVESQARLRNVAFDNLDLVVQKVEEPVAMMVEKRVENRRIFHHLFETALGRI